MKYIEAFHAPKKQCCFVLIAYNTYYNDINHWIIYPPTA